MWFASRRAASELAPINQRRALPRLARTLAVLSVLASLATTASAEDVPELAAKLKGSSDTRVRMQAALALGAAAHADAITPLCGGLDDSDPAVRTAAAAALGRLGMKAGLSCLKTRLQAESNESVKTQIRRSVSQLEGPGARAASRAPDASSKWYVAIATAKAKGDRNAAETDAIVQETIRTALLAQTAMAIAPPTETPAQGGAIVARTKLKGFLLQVNVDEPKYEAGSLTIVVRMTMLSYPGKSLQGEFTRKLTQSQTPSKDKASEDTLIKMAVSRAVADFLKVTTSS